MDGQEAGIEEAAGNTISDADCRGHVLQVSRTDSLGYGMIYRDLRAMPFTLQSC